ncbi:YDG domain-containing protein [Flavobacterium cerinum]|uniref:T9SS type A sorting domain-containing protein n=1 Tax=Flavobacterium cerinum TaxID=2502784 RepID=A0A3S3TZA0_9FLAO|nr:YDG domain-containing protein [Flavobacterium cerinum]RWW98742.1 T9SS type A sorting domain-containing protein [Flavobacterium cerinum]
MIQLLHQKMLRKLLATLLFLSVGVSWGQTAYTLTHGTGQAATTVTGITASYNGVSGGCSTTANSGTNLQLTLTAQAGYTFTITSIEGTAVRSSAGLPNFNFQLINNGTVNGTPVNNIPSTSSCGGGTVVPTITVATANQTVTAGNTATINVVRGGSGSGYSHMKTFIIKGVVTPTVFIGAVTPTTLPDFSTTLGTPSDSQSFTVDSGTGITGNITATAGAHFFVSLDNSTFTSSVSFANPAVGQTRTVYVRFNPSTTGTKLGSVALSSTGVASKIVSVKGIIGIAPVISSVLTKSTVYSTTDTYNISTSTGTAPIIYSADLTGIPAGATFTGSTISFADNFPVGNYNIPITATNGFGTVTATLVYSRTAKALTLTGGTAQNKIYDGLTDVTLTAPPSLGGILMGDDVTLTGTPVSAFTTSVTGNHPIAITSGYTLTGTNAGNYTLTLPQQPTGLTATITAGEITITGILVGNKIYDGTTTATITGTPILNGIANSEAITLDAATATALFATNQTGTAIPITVSGYTLSGSTSANYTLQLPSGFTADITAKELTISGIQIQNKLEDGTTSATITGTPALVGVINSDDVTLDSSAATAVFTTASVGAAIPVTVTGYTLNGTAIGNYTLQQPQGLIANITSATLQNQTITFDPLTTVTYGDTPFVLTATAVPSGLTVTYTSSDENVATVSGNIVTVVGIGSTTITANQAGNASFNPAPTVTQSLVVNKKTLTVAGATVDSKTYNKTIDAVLSNGTLSGIVGTDVVVLDGSTGTFASDDVANGIVVTPQYSISGADAGKYLLAQPALTGNILPKALTLATPAANNKMYDATTTATITGTLSGILSGDTVTYNGTGTFPSADAGTGITVTSTATLTGADAANYVLTQPTGLTANITKHNVTVNAIANNKAYDRTTNAVITATLNGVIGTDDVQITGNGLFNNFNVGINKPVTSNLVLSGLQANNYTLVQPTGLIASITPKNLTVDVTTTIVTPKNYDGTATASLTNTVLNGIVPGDEANVAAQTGAFAQTTPGTGITVNSLVLTGSAAGNYALIQPGSLTGTILPAVLTISSAAAQNKIYDKTNSAIITGTLAGIIPAEVVTFNGTGTFASVNVANGITVNATISLSGANASNYVLTQPTGLTANITPIALTVTATAQDKQYNGNTDTTVNGAQITAGSILPGDNVTLVSASVAGSFNNANVGTGKPVSAVFLIQGTDAANYTVTAQTYPAAITNLTLTADTTNALVATKIYDNNTNAVLTGVVLNGVLSGDTVNATTGNFASANAGTGIPVTITLSGAQAANYILTQPTTAPSGTISKKALTATADNKTKNQGAANPALTITYSGFVTGQTSANASGFIAPTANTTAVTGSPMGAYPITLTGGTSDNYDLNLVNDWLIVSPPTTTLFPSGTIWSNGITDGTPYLYNPYTIGDNVPASTYIDVSGIGRGSGIAGNAATGRYNANGWGLTFDSNDYFYFTITPKAGYKLNLTNFIYSGQASGTGPNTYAVKSSADNYTATIAGGGANGTINLSAGTYQNVTQPITFRVYAWGGNSATGTFSINDFSFSGSVIQAPTPVAPVINSTLVGNSNAGNTATYQITTTGTPVITLTAANLPAGASINNSGLISFDGTTPVGVYNITLNATSFYGTNTKTLVYTVNKINQILTFDPDPIPTKFMGDPDFVLEASSSTALPITSWVSSNPAVATIAADGTVTILSVGTTTLTASNLGDASYNPVSAGRLLTVLPKPILLATPTPITIIAVEGQGASAAVQLTAVTGTDLVPVAGTISLTVTTGFEIATDMGAYGNSGSFTYTGGAINQINPLIYVRLAAGHAVGTYTGTLTLSGGNATLTIPLNATVEHTPEITTTAANFGPYCAGSTNTVSLSYTTQGTFNTTSFYVQHSDATGVFPNDFTNIISTASASATITATLPSTLVAGNYKLRVVNLSSGLVIPSTNDNGSNVVINALPTLSAVTTACTENSAPIHLAGLLANGSFTVNYTINGGSVVQVLDVLADALGNATFNIPVTAANGGQIVTITELIRTDIAPACNTVFSTNNTVALIITPAPTATPLAFCSASTVANLTATGTDLKWYAALTGGQALANTEVIATGNYYVSQTINGCESTRTLVAVTVNVTPAPTAVPLAFCSASTVANLTATGTDLKWYAALTGGQALANTEVIATGNYYVSQTVNGCESTRTEVAITVNVTPAPTAAPLAFCSASTVANLTATGTDLKWYAALTGGSVLVNTSTITTGNYYVSQTINGCESTRTEVAVTVNVTPAPTAAPLAFCSVSTVANLTATGTDLKWYTVLTGGLVLANTEAIATGNYYVSQTLNGCESTRTEVAVTVNVTPAPTAAPLAFCSASTVANLTATGTNLKWYAALTGGQVLANTEAIATGNYYVSQTMNGCESTRTEVAVSVNVTPAPTAAPLAFCSASTVANLTATGTNLKWYVALTGGSVLVNTSTITTGNYYVSQTINGCESTRTLVAVTVNVTPAPTAAPLAFCSASTVANLMATGTNLKWYAALTGGLVLANSEAITTGNYYVSQTMNGCESTRTEVAVTVNVTPAPTAVPLSFCSASTVANLTATGTNLKWYSSLTGGSILANTEVLTTGNYYVSQTINGCESARTEVAVNMNPTAVPTAAPMVFCQQAFGLNLVATGTNLKWYTAATGGTLVTETTPLVSGNYYVSQTIDGCESLRTAVLITINITPAPTAGPLTFCHSATVANLIATGTDLKWYGYSTSGPVLENTTSLTTGNYYVSQTINGCESTRTLVAVTITITTAPFGVAQTFCENATVANLVATGTDLKWYTAPTGGSVLENTASLTTGNYYVSQTINGCESPRKMIFVTTNTTIAPQGQTEQLFTEGSTIADLEVQGENIKWYPTEADAIAGTNQLPANTVLVNETTYYATQTIGCESNEVLAVTVTITLGVHEVEKFTFSYYPNPVINELHIKAENTITNVTVYSLSGQEVMNQKWNKEEGVLDMSSLQAEIYLVKVNFGTFEKIIKVVRNHK